MELNKLCSITFPLDLWHNVSARAQDLVRMMTVRNPNLRPSSHACLLQPWLTIEASKDALLTGAVEQMKKYSVQYGGLKLHWIDSTSGSMSLA